MKERQKLGGELGGVNRALLQNQVELQQTDAFDLSNPRNKWVAQRRERLLKEREQLLGVRNARGESMLELAGKERDNAADLSRSRLELLGRLQDHFDLPLGKRVRSERDKGQKRQTDETYETLDKLGIRRDQADTAGEVDALIKRERERFNTEDRAREGEIARMREVMENAREQQAEVNDVLEEFALQQEALNKTTTAALDRMLQSTQRAREERDKIFRALQNR